METNKIYQGDCIELMKQLESNSIDLVLTSPPYDNLREYKGYNFNFEGIAKELFRIIKEGGVVVWVVGDATIEGNETGTSFRQALKFKEIGFNLWDTMIFQKRQYPPNCMSQNRYAQIFEYMFVFSKGKVKTFNRLMRPNKTAGQSAGKPRFIVQRDGIERQYGINKSKTIHDECVRENIWIINTGKASGNDVVEHPAVFPEQLAKDHILSWSNEGDLILDPMCGSGTTCKMALKNNRNFLGFEISKDYCKIAEERIKEQEIAKLTKESKS